MNNKTLNALVAVGMSAAMGATAIPASAGPLAVTPQLESSSSVIPVRNDGRDFHRRGGDAYYKGYRGSRHRKRGYREYNGFWFPLAAFGLGAVIGSTVRGSGQNAHVSWCYDHYRSYRAWDNTYQPYHGPRRQCYSPYS